jgi:hypothetical protein
MLLLGAARIPVAMLVLPAFAARLLWRLARSERPAPDATPGLHAAELRLAAGHDARQP